MMNDDDNEIIRCKSQTSFGITFSNESNEKNCYNARYEVKKNLGLERN